MNFQGLDPEQVSRSADGLAQQGANLDKVAHDIDALIRIAMHHWEGTAAEDFHQWWVGQHRPRLMAAAEGINAAARGVRMQVADQQHVSTGDHVNEAGGWVSGAAAGAGAAFTVFKKAWDGTNPVRAIKDIAEETKHLQRGWRHVTPWEWAHRNSTVWEHRAFSSPFFRRASHALAGIGVVMDSADVVDGMTNNDQGKLATGGAGLAVTAVGVVGGAAAAPVVIAGTATLAVGSTVLPVNNDEYAAAYDTALSRHFGSSYDPNSPTPAQAEWGMKRYSGVSGFYHSIGDGIMSKTHRLWGLL